jgi:hypothetical protein
MEDTMPAKNPDAEMLGKIGKIIYVQCETSERDADEAAAAILRMLKRNGWKPQVAPSGQSAGRKEASICREAGVTR